MLPSDILSVQFFKTYCNSSCLILLGQFATFKLIHFDDFNKLITDLYISIQELEIVIAAGDNQINENVIHINISSITDYNILLQHFGDDQFTNLEFFPYSVTTIR